MNDILQGQKLFGLRYSLYGKKETEVQSKFEVPKDSISTIRYLQSIVLSHRSKGHILAALDTIFFKKDSCFARIFIGEKFEIGQISFDENLSEKLFLKNFTNYNWKTKSIDSISIYSFYSTVLKTLANNGYPFGEMSMDFSFEDGRILQGSLQLDMGTYFSFDTLEIRGESTISKNFLEKYLDIIPGTPYHHDKVLDIKKKMSNVAFLQLEQDPIIRFVNDKALVILDLGPKSASRFDFIIGVQPGTTFGQRRFTITGDFLFDGVNLFKQGERMMIQIRRLSAEDQTLQGALNFPYIFGSRFGLDGSFEIRRNRNITLDRSAILGAQYILSSKSIIKLGWNYRGSSVINVDTVAILNTNRLPANLDFGYTGGSLSMVVNSLDYRFNPRSGYEVAGAVSLGSRSIVKNSTIVNLRSERTDFSMAYDTLSLTNIQFSSEFRGSFFVPVRNFGTIRLGLDAGIRLVNGRVVENELFRIGGNRLLRGFDELSIFSDAYAVGTAEFRLILDRDSYLTLPFFDVARLRYYNEGVPAMDTALGVGLGLNFATRVGIFNVAFAAGNRLGMGFDFQNTKVHFGYTNLF